MRTRAIFFISFLFSSLVHASRLFIDDPKVLVPLEQRGFDLARLVLNEPAPIATNEALIKNSSYAFIANSLASDLEDLKRQDPKLFISMKGSHRLFDSQWLIANFATYELVGIVNRMDRMSFQPETCGELRFIYRLSYRTKSGPAVYSRLPMTINSVFWIPKTGSGCKEALKKWNLFQSQIGNNKVLTLTKKDLPLGDLKSIEINMQSVRWPSTIRPDMAGYAEYFQRAFDIHDQKVRLKPLENTPDVKKIQDDPKLRRELLDWLLSEKNLKRVDEGTALLPEKFLSMKATSVALHGVHRLGNAPFNQIFKPAEFSKINWQNYESFRTPAGFLRRVNDLSCVGCHQGRTVAGFHFLGLDPVATDAVNSIHVSSSPHFLLDQKRRSLFVQAIQKDSALPHSRPLSVRAVEGEGRMGSHCGLGDASFKTWTCESGFECQAFTKDSEVSPTGICVPLQKQSGSPCLEGTMVHHADSKKDRIKPKPEFSCGSDSVCEASSVGFPNGMCAGSCARLKTGETCGSIAVLLDFNNCLAAGKEPFATCLAENVRPASLQECDSENFCRDDYICARTIAGKGACIPPYFLFQLRVDGHPSPGLSKEKFTFVDRLRKILPDVVDPSKFRQHGQNNQK